MTLSADLTVKLSSSLGNSLTFLTLSNHQRLGTIPKFPLNVLENAIPVGDRRDIPVLFIELQHHVVRGDAERPSTLVVLPAVDLIHVGRRHQAVIGVVVGVDRAPIVPSDVELDF